MLFWYESRLQIFLEVLFVFGLKNFFFFLYSQNECCPLGSPATCACQPCLPKLEDTIDYAFKLCGGIGMFFSFTEVSA